MNRSYQDQLVENIMIEAQRWNVKCQNPTDGSGDVIVDLPADLLVSMGLSIGDELTIEVVDGAIVLTPEVEGSNYPLNDFRARVKSQVSTQKLGQSMAKKTLLG